MLKGICPECGHKKWDDNSYSLDWKVCRECGVNNTFEEWELAELQKSYNNNKMKSTCKHIIGHLWGSFIHEGEIKLSDVSDIGDLHPFNYCPLCGEKL